MSNQHIQKQIEKADKIYMQDSTPGFKSFEYVQGYKQGVREMRELLIEALSIVWEEAQKEMLQKVRSYQMQIDLNSPSGTRTISVIPILALEEIERDLKQTT